LVIIKIIKKILGALQYSIISNKLYDDSDDPMFVLSKILEPETVNTIVDGGASIGETSQIFSKLFPNAVVHAFEPFPTFLDSLKKKSHRNKHIKVCPVALGNNNSSKAFNVNLSEGTNSLLKPNEFATEIYGSIFKTERIIDIQVVKLDEWFKTSENQIIDILKLDLQGGELDALRGAKNLFEQDLIKTVLCEFMFTNTYQEQASWIELARSIENYGLRFFNLYQKHYYKGQIIQADLLFIHPSILEESKERRMKNFHFFSNILITK
jgi:FkbM family methyltransferase